MKIGKIVNREISMMKKSSSDCKYLYVDFRCLRIMQKNIENVKITVDMKFILGFMKFI